MVGGNCRRRNWYGMGAVTAKPVRAGHVQALGIALWQLGANAAAPAVAPAVAPPPDLLHLRRPHGLGRIVAFCHGFASGLRTHVDRAELKYVDLPARATAAK